MNNNITHTNNSQQPLNLINSLKHKLIDEHFNELVNGSGIDPEVIDVNNIRSLITLPGELNDAHSYLNTYQDGKNVNANGTLKKHVADTYWNLDLGGWWCSGCEVTFNGSVFNTKDIEWGQFKPDKARTYTDEKGKLKTIKYESPLKQPTRLMLLHPSPRAWDRWLVRFETKGTKKKKCPYKFKTDYKKFWQYVAQTNTPIIICEGAKKALSLISQGYAAIAVPGIYGGYRNHETKIWELRKLHPDFKAFLVNHREWYFCFDGETKPHVKKNVDMAITRTAELLKKANNKNKVRVIELPILSDKLGAKTGVDDFIVEKGAKAFDGLFTSAPTLYEWKAKDTEVLSLYEGKHLFLEKEDLTFSDKNNRYYLPEDLFTRIPQNEPFIGVKAPMGAGKTQALSQVAKSELMQGGVPLLITHRVQLGQALANRLGVYYLSEIEDELQREQARRSGVCFCIDSMHPYSKLRFNVDAWNSPTIIIDEVEQVVHHLLFAATAVKENRGLIINNLGRILYKAWKSGRKIIVSDAHLTDLSLNFIRNLINEAGLVEDGIKPNIDPFIVTADEYYLLGNGDRQAFLYDHTQPTAWYDNLLASIEKGENVFICTDGQKESSSYGTQALGKRLSERFPNAKILVADSETTKDPAHPAFGITQHFNETLAEYNIFLCSPTIATGLSADLRGHFSSVWGRFSGVITPKQAVQMLGRLREDVPRHVWAAARGITEISGGSVNLKTIKAHQDYKYGELVRQLKASANFFIDEESETHMAGSCAALDAYCQIALRSNAGTKDYRTFVRSALINEGYAIIETDDIDGDRKQQLNEEIRQNKEELDDADSEKKAMATGCEEYAETEKYGDVTVGVVNREEVKNLREANKIDKYQEAKLLTVYKYNTTLEEITKELIAADKNGMYQALRLRYWLFHGRDFVEDRDWRVVDKSLRHGKGFKPDLVKDTIGPRVRAYEKANVKTLFQDGLVIHNKDKALEKLVMDLKEDWNKVELKSLFGFSVGDMESPVQIIRKIYKQFGYKLVSLGKGYYTFEDEYKAWSEKTLQRWLTQDKHNQTPVKPIALEKGKRVEPPAPYEPPGFTPDMPNIDLNEPPAISISEFLLDWAA